MSKKKIDIKLIREFVLAFFIVVTGFLLFTLILMWGVDKYNPATDDCDEWKSTGGTTDPNWTLPHFKCDAYEQVHTNWYRCSECTKWHKKSKCELDPNAEGCVCDEYNIGNFESGSFQMKWCNRQKQDVDYCISEEHLSAVKPEFMNDVLNQCEEDRLEFQNDCQACIKSHEATPCELGDEDYTIDGVCSGEVFEIENKNLNCSTGWEEVCRKIRITDYNCSILMENILKDEMICTPPKKEDRWWRMYDECYSHSDLVDIAKEKGCLEWYLKTG